MNNLHIRTSPFPSSMPPILPMSQANPLSASPSGPGPPGPPGFLPPVPHAAMDINAQRAKKRKMSHEAPQDRLEISPPSPSITSMSLALTSPSTSDVQILSPAAIYQSMEHGSVDALTPEGMSVLKNLNFSTAAEEGDDYVYSRKQKTPRDPMSHRIIEKRRRDRMNNCLADLSRLIPPNFIKQGQGRIEKTEIIEMAIKHLKHLHSILPKEEMSNSGIDLSKTQIDDDKQKSERYLMGYKECGMELMRFLMDQEGLTTKDRLFIRVVNHLAEKEKVIKTKVTNSEPLKGLDPPSCLSFNNNSNSSTSGVITSSSSFPTSSSTVPLTTLVSPFADIKVAYNRSECASTSDLHGSDETGSAAGSRSRQTNNVSVRSESSGYASAYNAATNRSLREELGLSELELEEERIKSQSKTKTSSRDDSLSVGVTETSLRDLLSNPEPLIPLEYGANLVQRSRSVETVRGGDGGAGVSNGGRSEVNRSERSCSRNSVHAFSTTSSLSSSKTQRDLSGKPHESRKPEEVETADVCEVSLASESAAPSMFLSSGTDFADFKVADSNSNSAFNFKKDLKQRFTNEGEENDNCHMSSTATSSSGHQQSNSGHQQSSTIGGQHTRISLMRGHNSKNSKDKIMEDFIKMKKKQDQIEKNEDMEQSSLTSPSPPETSSSCSDKSALSTMGIPCFALHPSGTFYVPIAIHPNLIQSTLEKKFGGRSSCPTVCHPVSIPVNFMSTENPAPSFSLHNINVGAAPLP